MIEQDGGNPLTEEDLTQLQILEYEFANPPRFPFTVDMNSKIRKR